jgi:single-strand DNA-binding protein
MQNITISGNLGKDAELRTVRDSQVLSFSVGVKNGFGSDAGSVWYRCSLWGKAAEVFDGLTKGTKVFISGELTHDEYEGKPQFNVRVGSIDTAPRSEERSAQRSVAPTRKTLSFALARKTQHNAFDDDLDDDCPF